MRYSHPHIQQTATQIPILCGLLFASFALLWLLLFQDCLLAFTRSMLSSDIVPWHPVFVAIFTTSLLLLPGVLLHVLLPKLPLRAKAMVWFPSCFLLGLLCRHSFPVFGDHFTGGWTVPIVLVTGYLVTLFLATLFRDSTGEKDTAASYIWPNFALLILFMFCTIWVSNNDRSLHHTLRANYCLLQGDSERVLKVAKSEAQPSRSLSATTAYVLAQRGELGDRLFTFPQCYGSDGLMPQMADTALFFNTPLYVGSMLGYCKGDSISTMRYLRLIQPLVAETHPMVTDYLLCAYLLERRLDDFARLLVSTADSISTELPLHYREALILYQRKRMQPITNLHDDLVGANFVDFLHLRSTISDPRERRMRSRDMYGNTYWCYYFEK